jgi:hypothetical protein
MRSLRLIKNKKYCQHGGSRWFRFKRNIACTVDVSSSGLNMFRQEGVIEDRFNKGAPNEVSLFSYFRDNRLPCKEIYCIHPFNL